jgi:nitroreductase
MDTEEPAPTPSRVMRTAPAVRDFRDDPVTDEVLYAILDDARFAPSGGNRQAWHVIVVDDPTKRERIRDLVQLGWREYAAHLAVGVRPFAPGPDGWWHGPAVDLDEARRTPAPAPFVDEIHRAPRLLVVTVDLTELAVQDVDLERQSIVGGASIYPFTQNVVLAARARGVGAALTTFLCRQEPAAKRLLGIPDGVAIAAMIVLGYPVRQLTKLRRNPVESFATVDGWVGTPLTCDPEETTPP